MGDDTVRQVAPMVPGRAASYVAPHPDAAPDAGDPLPRVWIDQELCTGDGICAQLAPDVFRIHWDGLAYVTSGDELLDRPGATVAITAVDAAAVVDAAAKCPGDCIYVMSGADGTVHGEPSPRAEP